MFFDLGRLSFAITKYPLGEQFNVCKCGLLLRLSGGENSKSERITFASGHWQTLIKNCLREQENGDVPPALNKNLGEEARETEGKAL